MLKEAYVMIMQYNSLCPADKKTNWKKTITGGKRFSHYCLVWFCHFTECPHEIYILTNIGNQLIIFSYYMYLWHLIELF